MSSQISIHPFSFLVSELVVRSGVVTLKQIGSRFGGEVWRPAIPTKHVSSHLDVFPFQKFLELSIIGL